MQKIEDNITTAIIAAVISVIVTVLIRFIEYTYNYRLDKKKSRLNLEINVDEKKIISRLDKYAILVEYIYRFRNLSRELFNVLPQKTQPLINELELVLETLKNYLYSFRFDLEQDKIFSTVHEYVHLAKNYQLNLSDYYSFSNIYDESYHVTQKNLMQNLFEELDKKHKNVISILTKIR